MLKCFVFLSVLGTISQTFGADILVLSPICLKNYYFIVSPLMKGLADRGHKVTVFSCMKYTQHENITQILVENIFKPGFVDQTKLGQWGVLNLMNLGGFGASSVLFSNQNFQALMKSQKTFDAVLSTDVPYAFALAAVDYRFSSIGISLINHCSSSHAYLMMGEYFNPAYIPEYKVCLNSPMNFFERMYNTFSTILSYYYAYQWILPRQERLLDEYSAVMPFLKERPPLLEIIANKSLVLVPSHPTVDYVHPHSPRLRNIAGINIQKNTNPLPDELENFISSSRDGVIVISWGSFVGGEKVEKCERILLSALHKLKYRVIWKRSNFTANENIPTNVKIVNWLPQQDVLAHKKVNLFMTHGGLNSMSEATHYGVPVIVTPFFFDQCRNAKLLVDNDAGLLLSTDNFTVDSVIWTVNEVLSNQKYKKSVIKRSQIFRDRLLDPVDEAVYWIEYVLRYGNVLKPASASIPFYKLFLLDIMASIFGAIFIVLAIVYYLLKFYQTFRCNYKKTVVKLD